MNETLEEMAWAIFKSWFVDFGPVRAKAEGRQPVGMDADTAALFPSRFVESELGEIPEGSEVTSLGAICHSAGGDIQTGPFGSQLHASDYVEDGIPSDMPKNLKEDRISTEDIARVRPEDVERLFRHKLEVGDIRKNATIDWSVRETVRARMRTMVRRLLRKYKYPPDFQEQATETVLKQAEQLAELLTG